MSSTLTGFFTGFSTGSWAIGGVMNFAQGALDWAPAFALVLARVGAAMASLPGIGEAVAPAVVRICLALSITILLIAELQPMMPPGPWRQV